MNTVIHSSIFLINDRQEILMVKEGKEKVHGLWNLPGGKMEHGEQIAQAAIREMKEETGLDVAPAHLIGIYTSNTSETDYIHFVFLAENFTGDISITDPNILEVQWIPVSNVQAMTGKELLNASKIHQVCLDYKEGALPEAKIIQEK